MNDFPLLRLDLWSADAVVLHWWLTNVNLDGLPFEHPAQRQALVDLLTELDQTVAAEATDEEIVRSHEAVTRPDPVRTSATYPAPPPAEPLVPLVPEAG